MDNTNKFDELISLDPVEKEKKVVEESQAYQESPELEEGLNRDSTEDIEGQSPKRKKVGLVIAIVYLVSILGGGYYYIQKQAKSIAPEPPRQDVKAEWPTPIANPIPASPEPAPPVAVTPPAPNSPVESLLDQTNSSLEKTGTSPDDKLKEMSRKIEELESALKTKNAEGPTNTATCDTDAIVRALSAKMDEAAAKKRSGTTPDSASVVHPPQIESRKGEVRSPIPSGYPRPVTGVVRRAVEKRPSNWTVQGLSPDRAVVTVNGQQQMVTEGQTIDGIKIMRIDAVKGELITSEGAVK